MYANRDLATSEISDYIDGFYNPTRRHRHLGGGSPGEFEAAHRPLGQVSARSWELQFPLFVLPLLDHFHQFSKAVHDAVLDVIR